MFRSIFLSTLCWLQPCTARYVTEALSDRKESIFFTTSLWTKPGHLLTPGWNVKCDLNYWHPQSRSLWCWLSAGHSCPSFPGHPCSVQFAASFITPVPSCEVIGHVLYLAANLSLTCNMQMLFSRRWVCSCCLFWGLSRFHFTVDVLVWRIKMESWVTTLQKTA